MVFRRRRATPVAEIDPADVVGSHVLLVRDPVAAEALAAELRASYLVTFDTHDGGLTWIVRAGAVAAGDDLGAVAARHGATYEGWEPSGS